MDTVSVIVNYSILIQIISFIIKEKVVLMLKLVNNVHLLLIIIKAPKIVTAIFSIQIGYTKLQSLNLIGKNKSSWSQ